MDKGTCTGLSSAAAAHTALRQGDDRHRDRVVAVVERNLMSRQGRREGKEIRFLCTDHDDHNPSARWNHDKLTWYCDVCGTGGGWKDLAKRLEIYMERNADQRDSNAARAILQEAIRDDGTIARYLAARGLNCPVPDGVLLHPSLSYWSSNNGASVVTSQYPAMIAPYLDASNQPVGVHLTYLAPGGTGKASVEIPKKSRKMNGVERLVGAAIRLMPHKAGQPLIVAEGIETAMAVAQATGWPAWAAGSAAHLQKVQIPGGVRTIYIATDLDHSAAGTRVSEALAARLHAEGRKVYVVVPEGPLPVERKTIDWLDRLVADGQAAVQQAFLQHAAWRPPLPAPCPLPQGGELHFTPLKQLLEEPEEEARWVWEGRLTTGGLSLLAGKPKAGKSTLARGLALAVARGDSFLGFSTMRGRVLYLALEEKRSEVRRHFKALGAKADDDIQVRFGMAPPDGLALLRQVAERERPTLIIVDPIFKFAPVKDGNDYMEVQNTIEQLLAIGRDTEAHVLALHHLKKSDGQEAGDGILGSTAIFGGVDTALFLRRAEPFRILSSMQRYGEDLEDVTLNMDPDSYAITMGQSRDAAEHHEMEDAIMQFVRSQPEGVTRSEINEAVTGRNEMRIKAINNLVADGRLRKTGKGGKADPFRYVTTKEQVLGVPPAQGQIAEEFADEE